MTENYNLIPAAELPVTEAKEVDVLCVENGELKRKAGANLGGGGGYVIKLSAESLSVDDITPDENGNVTEPITDIPYDDFIDVLISGGSIWVDFSSFFSVALGTAITLYAAAIGWVFLPAGTESSSENLLMLTVKLNMPMSGASEMTVTLVFSGTWTPEAEA